MTCRPVSNASKGTEPQERCRSAAALRRPLLAMLRRWGEGHERMWVGFLRIRHPGPVREYPAAYPREGQGHEGSAQPIRRYVAGSKTL